MIAAPATGKVCFRLRPIRRVRRRVIRKFKPKWEGTIEGWTNLYLNSISDPARIAYGYVIGYEHTFEDMLSEAYLCFMRCKDRYSSVVTNPGHFFRLYQSTFMNRCKSLMRRHYVRQDTYNETDTGSCFDRFCTYTMDVSEMLHVHGADPVVMQLWEAVSVDRKTRRSVFLQGKSINRRNTNEYLRRLLKVRDTDAPHHTPLEALEDIIGVLPMRNYHNSY